MSMITPIRDYEVSFQEMGNLTDAGLLHVQVHFHIEGECSRRYRLAAAVSYFVYR
jgi:hypothetical protein